MYGRKKLKKRKCLQIFERYWIQVLWLVTNSAVFYHSYRQYKNLPQYYYLRSILGSGLCISRGSAAILNLNCCLLLLPLTRPITTLVCRLSSIFQSRSLLLFWLQKSKSFHVSIAVTIVVFSVVHTAAHVVNALNFSNFYIDDLRAINWAKYKFENPAKIIACSLTGMSGVAMLATVAILAVTSHVRMRTRRYNLFWYTHHICYLFLLLFLIHPMSGILKEQTNVDSHKPGCFNDRKVIDSKFELNHSKITLNHSKITLNHSKLILDDSKSKACMENAQFGPIKSQGWLWMLLPTAIFILDKMYRVIRRNGCVTCVLKQKKVFDAILLTIALPWKELKVRPGQFVLVQCPQISGIEWHPFTVIKCSNSSQKSFQILMRIRGDWTAKLAELRSYNVEKILPVYHWPPQQRIRLQIDGPYHSPMQEIINCETSICIAAGIGITPFIANFNYILDTQGPVKPKKIHLIWVVRHVLQINWCSDLLIDLHTKFWNANEPDRFSFQIHLTRNQTLSEIPENEVLRRRLCFGKPFWRENFKQLSQWYQPQPCHVFVCATKSLSREIRDICRRFKNFNFVQESFS